MPRLNNYRIRLSFLSPPPLETTPKFPRAAKEVGQDQAKAGGEDAKEVGAFRILRQVNKKCGRGQGDKTNGDNVRQCRICRESLQLRNGCL